MKHLNAAHWAYLVLVVFVLQSVQTEASQLCPSFCSCDFYQGRNRAVCSAKRLISPNVEVPAAVEILDLSTNDIASLDNSCFQNYHFLVQLNLSHNSIETIYLDAFSKLRRIQTIDLSHNRLEYLDDRLFEKNRHLQTLQLAGNKFMSLQNKPLLRSKSLLTLNLSNARVHHLPTILLSGLPQLQQLDLSENLIITLNADVFDVTPKLRYINLRQNRWICDQSEQRTLEALRQRAIDVEIDACALRQLKVQKFERLEMLAPPSSGVPAATQTPLQLPAIPPLSEAAEISAEEQLTTEVTAINWRRLQYEYSSEDDDDDGADNPVDMPQSKNILTTSTQNDVCNGARQKLCQRYRKCLEKVSHILLDKLDVHREAIYTDNDLNLAFLLGTAVGITFVIFIMSCALCCKGCLEAHKVRKAQALFENEIMASPLQAAPISPPSSSPPPPAQQQQQQQQQQRRVRRSRRTAASSQSTNQAEMYQRAVVRHSDDRDNFLSRLFGRPARHQYYRTINENTATLIRRLSRSNLFNNRLSQHFTDRAPSSPSPTSSNRNAFDYDIVAENATPIAAHHRPETPPPNYGDCVMVTAAYDRK